MTDPRHIVAGESYLVTRRCTQRQFLLTPSALVVRIFLYVLGYTAQKYGIALHAFVMMSNHYHLGLTDIHGVLPKFTQELNSLLARALNALRGRRENFWSSDKPNYLALEGIEDIVAKCAYVLTNPVASGLVASRDEWPGAISSVDQVGGTVLRIKKPRCFFGKEFPDSVEIRLVPPPADKLEGWTNEEFVAAVRERADTDESDIRHAREIEGKGFLGRRQILRQSPFDSPSGSPSGRDGYSSFHPTVAAQDPSRRAEALERRAEFIRAYRAALAEYRAGNRDIVFPAGTWKMRVFFNVRCEPVPAGP